MTKEQEHTGLKLRNAQAYDVGPKARFIHGVIDMETVEAVNVGEYQREVLPTTKLENVAVGVRECSVPYIVCGMRGSRFRQNGTNLTLNDPVWVIDGLQRWSACKLLIAQGEKPHLGVTIRLDSTETQELKQFIALNTRATKLSPNIILRNLRSERPILGAIYRMSEEDAAFPLRGRICWQQRQNSDHLLSAFSLAKVVGTLQAHLGSGRSSAVIGLADSIQATGADCPKGVYIQNAMTFFSLIEECWHVSKVVYSERSTATKQQFLVSLATILDRHVNFWDGARLIIPANLRRKIAGFPVTDPNVQNLASAGGAAKFMLENLLVTHINSGKRQHRLVQRSEMEKESGAA